MDSQLLITLDIKGMHCAACSSRIERVIGNFDEVDHITVSLATNTALIKLQPGQTLTAVLSTIVERIHDLGFEAIPRLQQAHADDSLADTAQRWEQQHAEVQADLATRKKELLLAAFFTIPLFIISMGHMIGIPLPSWLSPATSPAAFALAQLALCLPVMWLGRRFYLQGFPALWRRVPNMDSLVALGTSAAFIYSLWNTVDVVTFQMSPYSDKAHLLVTTLTAPLVNQVSEIMRTAGLPLDHHGLQQIIAGIPSFMHDSVPLYYESTAVIITLISLGKYLELRSRMHTTNAIKGLLDLAPEVVTRLTPPLLAPLPSQNSVSNASQSETYATWKEDTVPLGDVHPNDILLVRPGGRIPVDGTVLHGTTWVDESMLTGESMPIEKKAGDAIAGGTMNQHGAFVMRADRVGANTMLARIIKLVQEAQGSKAPIANMADTISLYFVPVVIVIATIAGIFWYVSGESIAFSLQIFVSVLVIACPCAMGLATPMSIMVASGKGAQLGVLFKNGQALETASRITTMVFDKTGTLTRGKPSLVSIEQITPSELNESELLQLAASLEASSEHPLGKAIIAASKEQQLSLLPVAQFAAIAGKGVQGDVTTASGTVSAAIGNAAFTEDLMRSHLQPLSADTMATLATVMNTAAERGSTPVVLTINYQPTAVFSIADPIRPESKQVIATLNAMGISCVMLTGDNAVTADTVAKELGMHHVIAGILPDGKEAAIAKLQTEKNITGMVGDGVNDAPALARADVGFAMHSGIDIAIETGDVVLMQDGVGSIYTALQLSKATMRNIRENLFWAFAYNIIGIPFAAGIVYWFGGPVLSPMIAGAAMALSSVSVVTNALRLRLFTPPSFKHAR